MNETYKQHIEMAPSELEPADEEEYIQLIWEVVASRNCYVDRSVFSASQTVYSSTPRMPSSLMSDDMPDPIALALDSKCDWQKAREVRMAATVAMHKLDGYLQIDHGVQVRGPGRQSQSREAAGCGY